MTGRIRLDQLAADERLLDRLGSRADPGQDAVASLLAALARHADTPLRAAGPPRRFTRHRTLTALTALVVGASGAGVAAAVTQPQGWLGRDVPRVTSFEAAPRPAPGPSEATELTLPLLAAPRYAGEGYALVRDAAGRIVLLPQEVVVDLPAAEASESEGGVATALEPERIGEAIVEAGVVARPGTEKAEPEPVAMAAPAPKPKPVTGPKPGKLKPTPAGPPEEESLTLLTAPDPVEPPGLSIAAALRPSTPGTESGPGVPASPEKPEKPEQAAEPEKPDQAAEPEKPEQVDSPEAPEKPEAPDKPETPEKPDQAAEPEKPEQVESPHKPEQAETPEAPEEPETPEPEQPEAPEPVARPSEDPAESHSVAPSELAP